MTDRSINHGQRKLETGFSKGKPVSSPQTKAAPFISIERDAPPLPPLPVVLQCSAPGVFVSPTDAPKFDADRRVEAQVSSGDTLYFQDGVAKEPASGLPPMSSRERADLSRMSVASAAPKKAYVLKFSNGAFLRSYQDDQGISKTPALDKVKIFWSVPHSAADLLHARIIVVLVDGHNIRRTIIEVGRGCGDTAAKDNQASDTKAGASTAENNPAQSEDCAGVREADGAATPPSFLIQTLRTTRSAQLEDGKRLLFHFIEEFLTIKVYGLQSGFDFRPDSLLFVGPHGGTLAVPVSILLEPREIALELVREKICKSVESFAKRSA